jgi:hypothetical protein
MRKTKATAYILTGRMPKRKRFPGTYCWCCGNHFFDDNAFFKHRCMDSNRTADMPTANHEMSYGDKLALGFAWAKAGSGEYR